MSLIALRTFEELDDALRECAPMPEAEALDFLNRRYFEPATAGPRPNDPFTQEYREWVLDLYRRVGGREVYQPREHEQARCHAYSDVRSPSPYHIGVGSVVGNLLISWGYVLRTLNLKAGQTLLEYGPGTGQLLIHAARLGVRAAGIDVNPDLVAVIREQARRLDLHVRVEFGEFGDTPEPGARYDVVLFHEAFHHSLDHIALVDRLHDVVADDGVLALCGEAVLDEASPFRCVIPGPWGPRLDLQSIQAIRTYGWMELGFHEEYLLRLFHRSGWLVRKHPCSLTPIADMFVARKNHGQTSAGELCLPADEAVTWHAPEGLHRWTRGHALITLDSRVRWSAVTLTLANHNPRPVPVEVACGPNRVRTRLSNGETRSVTVPLPGGTRRLEVVSPVFCPKTLGMSQDDRSLGVHVGEIVYS